MSEWYDLTLRYTLHDGATFEEASDEVFEATLGDCFVGAVGGVFEVTLSVAPEIPKDRAAEVATHILGGCRSLNVVLMYETTPVADT